MTKDAPNHTYDLIETDADLKKTAKRLELEKVISVDVEADSMFNFKEKVCLIQIASPKVALVIDPLKIKRLSPLKPLFANPGIKKILHGADFDIRSLYRDFGIHINNLFDTELACRFLGIRETGLNAVLKQRFDIHLDKKFQKKNWSMRPLPGVMTDYAARDVFHLNSLAKILEKELRQKGRLSWVSEECQYLSNVRPVLSDGDPLFLKLRGAGRLDRCSLGVLEALLQFRIKEAEKKNRPVFKILLNRSLLTMARQKPVNLRQLKETGALSPTQISMYGEPIMTRVKKVLRQPEKKLPLYPRTRTPAMHPAVPARVKALKKWRDKKSKDLDIDPPILFNKNIMISISIQKPKNLEEFKSVPGIKNWQTKEFGKEIIEVLKGVM